MSKRKLDHMILEGEVYVTRRDRQGRSRTPEALMAAEQSQQKARGKPLETMGLQSYGAKEGETPLCSPGCNFANRRKLRDRKVMGAKARHLRQLQNPAKRVLRGEEAQRSKADVRRQAGVVKRTLRFGAPAKAQQRGFRGEKETQGSAADARRQAGGAKRTLRRRGHASPAAGLFASEISKERKNV